MYKTILIVSSMLTFVLCGCKLLRQINIPKSLKTIGSDAFEGCDLLEPITIPKTVKIEEEDLPF